MLCIVCMLCMYVCYVSLCENECRFIRHTGGGCGNRIASGGPWRVYNHLNHYCGTWDAVLKWKWIVESIRCLRRKCLGKCFLLVTYYFSVPQKRRRMRFMPYAILQCTPQQRNTSELSPWKHYRMEKCALVSLTPRVDGCLCLQNDGAVMSIWWRQFTGTGSFDGVNLQAPAVLMASTCRHRQVWLHQFAGTGSFDGVKPALSEGRIYTLSKSKFNKKYLFFEIL